jgi:hypothetical protein
MEAEANGRVSQRPGLGQEVDWDYVRDTALGD